jgi:hypothetical protein
MRKERRPPDSVSFMHPLRAKIRRSIHEREMCSFNPALTD